ncbi:hypothetical protein, partial [Bosea sp. (in: a-proteobacteria)]|uniref:ABC transporter ATP-binding protein n=1 Tax=Bosea sp. (in: a-proteobacteria) TaxID=1871050 RepID=UPI003B3AD06C
EQGTRDQIFDDPKHTYTRKLLAAVPSLQATPEGGVSLCWRNAEHVTTTATQAESRIR